MASAVNYVAWLGWNPLGRTGDFGYNGLDYNALQIVGVGVVELALLIGAVWLSRARWITLFVPFVWTGVFANIEKRRCQAYGCDGLWALGGMMLFVGAIIVCLIVGLVTHQVATEHRERHAEDVPRPPRDCVMN